jgi:hypothetical protein
MSSSCPRDGMCWTCCGVAPLTPTFTLFLRGRDTSDAGDAVDAAMGGRAALAGRMSAAPPSTPPGGHRVARVSMAPLECCRSCCASASFLHGRPTQLASMILPIVSTTVAAPCIVPWQHIRQDRQTSAYRSRGATEAFLSAVVGSGGDSHHMGAPASAYEQRGGEESRVSAATGAGEDHEIDHHKNPLRFPYVSDFLRSHYLHPHPYIWWWQ